MSIDLDCYGFNKKSKDKSPLAPLAKGGTGIENLPLLKGNPKL
jgi:hypothetical protein